MRVKVNIEEASLPGDYKEHIPGIHATCTKCGLIVSMFGRTSRSIHKACITLREKCPEGPVHYYSHLDKEEEPPEDMVRLFKAARKLLHTFETKQEIQRSVEREYAIGLLKEGLGCKCPADPRRCPAHAKIDE
jgi:hypothetical protein